MLAQQRIDRSKAPRTSESKSHEVSPINDSVPQNLAWQSLALRHPAIQTKLAVSQPSDVDEQEADRVADQVLRLPSQSNHIFQI